jgi:DNA segregation ATPase FtsK/SpoIIIE-like protein
MLDELYGDAEKLARSTDNLCIGTLQRRLWIGYNRASRLMDSLIENGVVERNTDDFGVTYRLTHNETK